MRRARRGLPSRLSLFTFSCRSRCCRWSLSMPEQSFWIPRRQGIATAACFTRSAVQRFFVVRFRDAAAPARFFTPPDDFGREPEGFFALPLDAFFPADAADFMAVARDSFFAAVLDRVFVFVPRVFVLDADRFFAVDAPFRERTMAVGLRAGAAARRLDAASSTGSGASRDSNRSPAARSRRTACSEM